MSLSAGARLGPYEIVSLLGAGGMGQVYKARDTRLNRTVALKTLTEHVSDSADLKKRFEREAQAVAALNHPHICVLHDIGAQEGIEYLVMELLEGDTLAERLSKGPLPLDLALRYAAQIADALDKAHRQGVLHRDLKPGNIMITKSGAKLLDFGLAKLREGGEAAAAGQTLLPTMASGLTAQGTILGTLQYMAPEQLEGRDTDARADLFSFGALVYEMVTGRKAFEGRSQASVIAAILDHEPAPVSSLAPMTPPALDHLIRVCMAKDPADRWQTAHDILKQIEWISTSGSSTAPAAAHSTGTGSKIWIAATVLLGLTSVLTLFAIFFRDAPRAAAARFTVALPSTIKLLSNGSDDHHGALSPDGRHLVFSGADATGKIQLYTRALDSVEPAPIPGTEGGTYPFWSADGRSIAFYAQGKLKRVDAGGGAPQVICDAATGGWGGTWNRDDIVVAGVTDPGPLSRVSAKGGEPVPVTSLSGSETDHDWPQFLPDGKHFLYVAWGTGGTGTVYATSLDAPDRKTVMTGVQAPAFYADPGYLLFLSGTTLLARRFDVKSLELVGEPVPLADNVSGAATVSVDGVLAYRAAAAAVPDRLAWVSRDGREERPLLEPGYYADPALSPDGARLAFAKKDSFAGAFDVWILELAGGAQRRLTFDAADDRAPVWSPDGRSVVFSSSRKAGIGLYRKSSDGAGDEELIVSTSNKYFASAYQWSSDGRFITYYGGLPSSDISMLSVGDLKSTLLLKTAMNEMRGAISPDGRWLAYDSRETTRFEVYLTTFPPSSSKWMVTTDGGAEPKWSKDGKELFYVNSLTGALMSVDIKTGPPPTFGTHRRIYDGPLDWGWSSVRSFDIDPKGQRFLVETLNAPSDMTVLLNWPSLLKK